jgi:cyclophilin family peptidyl-prolyl cis-trans isomerase
VPKRKRREQQHLRQESTRRKSYQVGGVNQNEVFKPGFPMNLFGNIKAFAIVGVVVAIIMVVTAIFTTQGSDTRASDAPTPTPTATPDPNATPTPEGATPAPGASPTPDPKKFTNAEQVVDASKNTYTAVVKTSKGEFKIALNAEIAPGTVNSFVFLAQKGYFDNTVFHRVVTNFVVQGGDPTGQGTGGPGYKTVEEPNNLQNKRGTVSMAKTPGAKDFGSQFFINLKDNPSLDFNNSGGDKFYPFGEVTEGLDVVDAIGRAGSVGGKPVETVTVQSVTITVTPK